MSKNYRDLQVINKIFYKTTSWNTPYLIRYLLGSESDASNKNFQRMPSGQSSAISLFDSFQLQPTDALFMRSIDLEDNLETFNQLGSLLAKGKYDPNLLIGNIYDKRREDAREIYTTLVATITRYWVDRNDIRALRKAATILVSYATDNKTANAFDKYLYSIQRHDANQPDLAKEFAVILQRIYLYLLVNSTEPTDWIKSELELIDR